MTGDVDVDDGEHSENAPHDDETDSDSDDAAAGYIGGAVVGGCRL